MVEETTHNSVVTPDSIDRAVDEFWGPIFEFDYSKPLEAQKEAFERMLVGKYGAETIKEFHERDEKYGSCTGQQKIDNRIFLYKTGLYDDGSVEYNLEGREIFRLLAKYLGNSGLLANFGCGDGKMDFGLALLLPELRILSIEIVDEAVQIMHEKMKQHPNLNGRIRIVHNNYCDTDLVEALTRNPPNVGLFCRSNCYCEPLYVMHEFAEAGMKLVGCRAVNVHSEYDDETNRAIFLSKENDHLNSANVAFDVKAHKRTSPKRMVFVGEYSIINS